MMVQAVLPSKFGLRKSEEITPIHVRFIDKTFPDKIYSLTVICNLSAFNLVIESPQEGANIKLIFIACLTTF